jgi:hypothetical protein
VSPKERALVPKADFRSYYGRPVLKEPAWKLPDVPLYLTAGGMAGSGSVLAVLADLTRRPGLARGVRAMSAGGAVVGTVALIHDLGRPERFLYMLRVLKVTSPLSVGSWILAPYTGLAVAASLSERTGILRPLGRLAGLGSAVLGPPLATYTAVLLADTAVPTWHEAYRELPYVFAASAAAAGGGAGLLTSPVRENGPAARLGVAAAVTETVLSDRMEKRLGMLGEPYSEGVARPWMRAAKALTVAGAVGAALGRRNRVAAALSGAALVGGSFCTRWGVFVAGRESSRDPKYTVVPQRERLRAPDAESAATLGEPSVART